MKKNWDRAAMRFASASYMPRQGMLDVLFENGDHFVIATEAVLTRAAPPEWTRLRIGETGDVLEVPSLDTIIEIPWDRIRSIVDPAFRAELLDQSEQRARRIGERIRSMRLEAGLPRDALAEQVGVSRETIADLEAGKIEPQIDLIEHIALALGSRLRDFAEE